MKRYLLDTNHASDWLKPVSALTRPLQSDSEIEIGIPTPCIAELWYMVRYSARIRENSAQLRESLKGMRRFDFDEVAAEEFGEIKSQLRRSGRKIPDIDVQIAAIAIAKGLTVLTADAHYGYIAGLQTENWIQ